MASDLGEQSPMPNAGGEAAEPVETSISWISLSQTSAGLALAEDEAIQVAVPADPRLLESGGWRRSPWRRRILLSPAGCQRIPRRSRLILVILRSTTSLKLRTCLCRRAGSGISPSSLPGPSAPARETRRPHSPTNGGLREGIRPEYSLCSALLLHPIFWRGREKKSGCEAEGDGGGEEAADGADDMKASLRARGR